MKLFSGQRTYNFYLFVSVIIFNIDSLIAIVKCTTKGDVLLFLFF